MSRINLCKSTWTLVEGDVTRHNFGRIHTDASMRQQSCDDLNSHSNVSCVAQLASGWDMKFMEENPLYRYGKASLSPRDG